MTNERKARRELEEWYFCCNCGSYSVRKTQHEAKMEEMKKKVRVEVEARLKLEEDYKKLEREYMKLKNGN